MSDSGLFLDIRLTGESAAASHSVVGYIVDTNEPCRLGTLVSKEDWGAIGTLNGSFAVVVQSGNSVRLISDRLGTRPLFYWSDGAGRIVVAERLAKLVAQPGVTRNLDRQGILELVAMARPGGSRTQYAGVRSVPGGSMVTLQAGGTRVERLHRVSWTSPECSRSDMADRLAEALKNAALRLKPTPGMAVMLLSGGVDARTVVAALSAAGAEDIIARTLATHATPESRIAKTIAAAGGMIQEIVPLDVDQLGESLDQAVTDSDGLYAAPIFLGAHGAEVARDRSIVFSGHGLDYMLRGMYLPCRTLRLAGSVTRLPRLRQVADNSPETVQRSLRVGIDPQGLASILVPEMASEVDARRTRAMAEALAGADPAHPADAWDAYLLTTQCRHYAYSDFVAIHRIADHRVLAFDTDVLDCYFAMPAAWRAEEWVARTALGRLSPEIANLADANTGFRQSRRFEVQVGLMLARGVARRAGLFRAPAVPGPMMTNGSWPNTSEVLRRAPALRQRVQRLSTSAALLDTGLFDSGGLARLVSAHLEGSRFQSKLLLALLALESWISRFGYDGTSDDSDS